MGKKLQLRNARDYGVSKPGRLTDSMSPQTTKHWKE